MVRIIIEIVENDKGITIERKNESIGDATLLEKARTVDLTRHLDIAIRNDDTPLTSMLTMIS